MDRQHEIIPAVASAEGRTEERLVAEARQEVAKADRSAWRLGELASEWTKRYAEGRTDADFGEEVGLSQQRVSERRLVWQKFGEGYRSAGNLSWTHHLEALTWPDADQWLDWASRNNASVAKMKAARSEAHQAVETLFDGEQDECTDDDPAPSPPTTTVPTPADIPEDKPAAPPKAHIANNSGEFEWYTPPEITALARIAMDGIDLDPASTEYANTFVLADAFFSLDDDGLSEEWWGSVWLNPPYSADLVGKFADKLIAELAAGRVIQACMLVNNGTETKWFQRACQVATAACFPSGRIKFFDKDGEQRLSPLQGQCVLYFGEDAEAFIGEFSDLGVCMEVVSG